MRTSKNIKLVIKNLTVKKPEKNITKTKPKESAKKKHERLNKEKFELEKNQAIFLRELFSKCSNFGELGEENVKKFFINEKYEIPHARKIMGDFITLLRKEGINPKEKKKYNEISTSIKDDCFINFQNGDQRCFCCGEDIKYNVREDGKLEPKDVACDHVIPVITMLLTVKTDSISKNLHYIHNKCNGAKTNRNI